MKLSSIDVLVCLNFKADEFGFVFHGELDFYVNFYWENTSLLTDILTSGS